MKPLKILQIVGARPNFIKLASLQHAMKNHPELQSIVVHTGQHFDENMSKIFFKELEIPAPDINLEVGPGSHASQTAEIMKRLEPVMLETKPDLVVVVGDVNSTMAAAIVAAKLGIRVAHVEAGLRSFDRRMPEEINRLLTDVISDYLFVSEKSGLENLKKEGIPSEKIFFVGNVMIDTLRKHQEKAKVSDILFRLGLQKENTPSAKPNDYTILTLHRPSNVDNPQVLKKLFAVLNKISSRIPVIFPVHPRTLNQIRQFQLGDYFHNLELTPGKTNPYPLLSGIYLIPPLGYLDFLRLMMSAKFAMTDSGGIQEETTALGVPCITLRENTERPATVDTGSNILVGYNYELLLKNAENFISQSQSHHDIPELWDGKAAERILSIILNLFCQGNK